MRSVICGEAANRFQPSAENSADLRSALASLPATLLHKPDT